MEPRYALGALTIVGAAIWGVAMLVMETRTPRGKHVIPELPKIPQDCIDALRARAEDPCAGCPRNAKKGATPHGQKK